MSLTRDRTDNREDADRGNAHVLAVRRTVAEENTETDCHLVRYGIPTGDGSGPDIINNPRFNWVL